MHQPSERIEPSTTHQSLSERIVLAVAAADGVDPVAFGEPLFETLDPDALDALVESLSTPTASLRFRFAGHWVTVTGDGAVTVE
jgi:hypothetical protein